MSNWKLINARWGSGAGETEEVRMNGASGALLGITNAHHQVHEGNHFTYSQSDADFDIADAVELLIITPNTTKWAHMIFDIEAVLDTTVEIYENTAAAGHTVLAAQTAFNNNRNSGTSNTTTINTHNDDGADGTLIFKSVFGVSTGTGINHITGGGAERAREEWILKQNSKYVLKITSGTDNSVMSLKLSWYEHTSIN